MKRLAVIAALVAVFALPTIGSGLGFAEMVPAGTIDVECATWRYENDEPFPSIPDYGVPNIFLGAKATNADIVRAVGAVEDAVLEVKVAIERLDFPTVRQMTCVEWQEFVIG